MEQESPYNAFQRHSGKLTKEQITIHVDKVPYLQPWEREYVKRVLERFDNPPHSQYLTKEEFFVALEEMAANQKDPITPDEIERIKKIFLQ